MITGDDDKSQTGVGGFWPSLEETQMIGVRMLAVNTISASNQKPIPSSQTFSPIPLCLSRVSRSLN